MKIPSGKTKVILIKDVHQSDFKKGDIGYIDGYVQAADRISYAVVVRLSDRKFEHVPIYKLEAIAINEGL